MARQSVVDRTVLEAALIGLEHQKSEIDAKAAEIRRRLRGLGSSEATPAPVRRKRKLSPAARRRIAEATKKRWAEYRAMKASATPAKKTARKKAGRRKRAASTPAEQSAAAAR